MIISQKRDINVQAGSDWAIFGKISDAQAQAVPCYMNEYFLYFCLVVWTLQNNLGLFGREINEARLWCLTENDVMLTSSPSEIHFLGRHQPIYLSHAHLQMQPYIQIL